MTPGRLYTIDASVFGNSVFPDEPGHETSKALLAQIQAQETPIVAPTLVLVEVAALIARRLGGGDHARRLYAALAALPNLTLIGLTRKLAQSAADIAAQHRLRGADAVYIAVALRYGATLITLDKEQRERTEGVVRAQYPVEISS